ncbi:MAG: GNAT family N-acetyltransferase [Lachnospiraceae bacterium]|nr:GNAT family N-acetyltransferase [Lachnospiraceae bacterium]MCI9152069.1 GNAT family N-acetyltransferase [Lachnospiraceae bacterium]
MNYQIIKLRDHAAWKNDAAAWFHEKWHIPREAYLESMEECLANSWLPEMIPAAKEVLRAEEEAFAAVPQWYLAVAGDRILGGLGVIENDFHDRKDLAPNVCAVYVEEDCRCQGIAGRLLDTVCRDMEQLGIGTLYLLTDHTSFYERYGWEFLCMARGDGEEELSRIYVRRTVN